VGFILFLKVLYETTHPRSKKWLKLEWTYSKDWWFCKGCLDIHCPKTSYWVGHETKYILIILRLIIYIDLCNAKVQVKIESRKVEAQYHQRTHHTPQYSIFLTAVQRFCGLFRTGTMGTIAVRADLWDLCQIWEGTKWLKWLRGDQMICVHGFK
jgi:hypothetical protein